jgi:para-aminobenzoate synthetase component 1
MKIEPQAAFLSLRGLPLPFLMSASPLTGGRRHSVVGGGPFLTVAASDVDSVTVESGGASHTERSDVFSVLSRILKRYSPLIPFGAGFFSYDLKNAIERGRFRPGPGPLCIFGFYDAVYVYDHMKRTGRLVSAGIEKGALEEISARLESHPELEETSFASGPARSNLSKADYILAVEKALGYIAAGDIYQINISRRLEAEASGDPFSLYLSLLRHYPSRFPSFMDFGDFKVISNSPERLLRVKDGVAETEPIKGTRPRGASPFEDLALAEELRKDPKERAEHTMIVDLCRNDIGRISRAGTVEVAGFQRIETFPAIHHMVSTVRGMLRPGVSPFEALRVVFPGGSVTGAPKIRAMEIIDEIERDARGIYTGGVGLLYGDTLDISMAIRTAVFEKGKIGLSVGSGIVADSRPEKEYEETVLKGGDFLKTTWREPA